MSRLGVLLLVCTILLQWQATMAWRDPAMTPPAGYGLSLLTKTNKALQMYTCDRGTWIKTGAFAELFDPTNTNIGTFQSVYSGKAKHPTMNWTLVNSPGDQAESGFATSGVSGMPISSRRLSIHDEPQLLCEVTAHQGIGTASMISYVVLTQTKGGVPPNPFLCILDGTSVGVPFSGVFEFYTQSTQPPDNVPRSITPNGRVIEGLFVKGRMVYKFDGSLWHPKGLQATIYNVAGGDVIGQYGTLVKPDKYGSALHWKFNDPNGFWLTGKLSAKPVKVAENGCPWQLMAITSTGGYMSPVGPYKYAQLTSTRGGQPPPNSAGTPGLLWNSPFSGIFWFYTNV